MDLMTFKSTIHFVLSCKIVLVTDLIGYEGKARVFFNGNP